MAMRYRKLLPALADSCQGSCEEACNDNCYNNSDYNYSDYNFRLSPPLPPPNLSSRTPNIAPYAIVVLIILAILFLASVFLLAVKSRAGWFRSRNDWEEPQSQTDNRDEEFLDEIRTAVHPIWFIARMGLHQSTINSISVLKYRKGEGLIEGTECSVCLNEFQEDETLRLLPKCNHAFHISCIDTWLRSHTNCPLCRAHIVDDVVDGPLISVNRNPDHLNAIVGPQMENHETNADLDNAQQRNQPCEGRGGAEEERELANVDDKGHSSAPGSPMVGLGEESNVRDETILKGEVDSESNGDQQLTCDAGDDNKETRDGTQQTRRSLSTDYLTDASMRLDLANHSPIESQGILFNQIGKKEMTGSAVVLKQAIRQCRHNGPASLKRSSSS